MAVERRAQERDVDRAGASARQSRPWTTTWTTAGLAADDSVAHDAGMGSVRRSGSSVRCSRRSAAVGGSEAKVTVLAVAPPTIAVQIAVV